MRRDTEPLQRKRLKPIVEDDDDDLDVFYLVQFTSDSSYSIAMEKQISFVDENDTSKVSVRHKGKQYDASVLRVGTKDYILRKAQLYEKGLSISTCDEAESNKRFKEMTSQAKNSMPAVSSKSKGSSQLSSFNSKHSTPTSSSKANHSNDSNQINSLTSALSGSTSSPSANTFINTHALSSTSLLSSQSSSPQNLNPAFIEEFQAMKSALEEVQNNHAQFMDQNNSTVEAI
jgi:hypothetical protein